MREALKAREIVPGFEEAGNVLIASYDALGRFEDAARIITQQRCWGLPLDGETLALAFREGGARGYWLKRLELMDLVASVAPPMVHVSYTVVHCQLGNIEEALHHVERMVEERLGGCVFLGVDPAMAVLRGHPRFDAVLTRVGAPLPRTASAPRTTST